MKFWLEKLPKFLAKIFATKGYFGTQMYRPYVYLVNGVKVKDMRVELFIVPDCS